MRLISGNIQMKPEERYKYEIFKTFESSDFSISFWWSPIERCGYRMRPIEFKRPNVSIEMPRNMVSNPIYMRCLWTRHDSLSALHSLSKYFLLVIFLFVNSDINYLFLGRSVYN